MQMCESQGNDACVWIPAERWKFFVVFFFSFFNILPPIGSCGCFRGCAQLHGVQHSQYNSVPTSLLFSRLIYSASYAIYSAEVPIDRVMLGETVKALKLFHSFGVGLMTNQTPILDCLSLLQYILSSGPLLLSLMWTVLVMLCGRNI